MNRLSIIRTSGLELEATDDAVLTALGPGIYNILSIIKLGEKYRCRQEYANPLMEIALLGMDQCATYRR